MSYKDKIETIVDAVDPGEPVFRLIVDKGFISPREDRWNVNLTNISENSFYHEYIRKNIRRTFDTTDKKWQIDKAILISKVERDVIRDINILFTKCSPAVAPKRTKVYKNFKAILDKSKHNVEFMNSMFDIAEYHWNQTQTDSILSATNDVHRKNIFRLLCLMEKSYGKK